MGILTSLAILLVVGVIAWSFFSTEITAVLDDGKSLLRDDSVSLGKPQNGTPVYDLQMDVKIKVKGVLGSTYLLFLNEEGGTFTKKWINPHLYENSLLSFLVPTSLIDYFEYRNTGSSILDLATNEIYIGGNSGVTPTNFKLSFILVDPDTGLQIKLSKYQDVPFSVPALTSIYTFDTKLIFEDLPKTNYELWIIPTIGSYNLDVRFADHAVGEKYVQKVTP